MKKQIIIGILSVLPFLSKAQNIVTEPRPGKIKSEVKDAVLNIATLTLSNGMKVILKPTDAEPGVVYFALLSPIGTSEYSNADNSSAFNVPQVIKMGGAGKFDQKELGQYLTGKKISINPVVVNTYSVFNDRAATSDLATALELNYAYITAPRIDANAYKAAVEKTKETYKYPVPTANSFFKDTVALIKNNYNTRFLLSPIQALDAVNPDRSLQIFKELFADASTCTAIFVGEFDAAAIKPLLEKYLANLPVTTKHKMAKDVGIYPPTGKIEKTFYKGNSTRAQVQLLYSGFASYSKKNEYIESFLQDELKKRLTTRLKAEDPDLYGPGVDIALHRANNSYFTATVEFACTPAKVNALTTVLKDEIRKMEGPDPLQIDVDGMKTKIIAELEESQKTDGFWLSYFKKQAQYNESVTDVASYPEIIKSITPDDIKKAAITYLNEKNQIRFVLMPEANK